MGQLPNSRRINNTLGIRVVAVRSTELMDEILPSLELGGGCVVKFRVDPDE